MRLADLAEQEGRGMHTRVPGARDAAVRNVTVRRTRECGCGARSPTLTLARPSVRRRCAQWEVPEPATLLEELRRRPQRAIVEYIRDGASFRCLLLDSMTTITLNLSGVQCPRLNLRPPRAADKPGASTAGSAGVAAGSADAAAGEGAGADADAGDEASSESGSAKPTTAAAAVAAGAGSGGNPEPFAREARFFSEVRLLHREVFVHVEGVSKTQVFYGTVEHPQGDISAELLKNGLARAVEWSMGTLPADFYALCAHVRTI